MIGTAPSQHRGDSHVAETLGEGRAALRDDPCPTHGATGKGRNFGRSTRVG